MDDTNEGPVAKATQHKSPKEHLDDVARGLRHRLVNALAAYGIMFFYTLVFMMVLGTLAADPGQHVRLPTLSVTVSALHQFASTSAYLSQNPAAEQFMLLVFAPVFEEAFFRVLPIALVTAFAVRRRRDALCAVVVAWCGIFFGVLHGSPVNVLLQGFHGVVLGLLFLSNRPTNFQAYCTCIMVHSMFNFTVSHIG